jgi:tripartite ATP-independent transporter DctM subunit
VVYVLPLLSIFVVVVGSMLLGWASPTEAAAIGCLAAFLAAGVYRRLSWSSLSLAFMETTKISVMILFIIVASTTFSQILSFSGATRGILQLLNGLDISPLVLVIIMLGILLILGAFMDQISMIMVTLPFFIPLVGLAGIEPLWFAVLMLICMEISFMTPPFGLLIFVMKGVAPKMISLAQVYRAAAPFVGLQLLVLVILLVWPAITLWLPGIMQSLR